MSALQAVSLKEAYAPYFPVGAAVNPTSLARSADLISAQYASVTAENCMKPEPVHPAEDTWRFAEPDALVSFAKEHGLLVRGHTLVWHNQTPGWLFAGSAGTADTVNRERLVERLREHMGVLMGRYKGAVYCWDVVNEAVDDTGPGLLRDTKWLQTLGEGYIRSAFELAHAADPQALLFYNDYNECDPGKRDRIVTLLNGLVAQGTPIHGFGMQGHWGPDSPTVEEVRRSIEAYAATGLKVQITELDLSMYAWGQGPNDLKAPTEAMLQAQGKRCGELFDLFREYRDVITGVTWWGAADDITWLDGFPVPGRKNWPLLFDTEHAPKPAFRAAMAF